MIDMSGSNGSLAWCGWGGGYTGGVVCCVMWCACCGMSGIRRTLMVGTCWCSVVGVMYV